MCTWAPRPSEQVGLPGLVLQRHRATASGQLVVGAPAHGAATPSRRAPPATGSLTTSTTRMGRVGQVHFVVSWRKGKNNGSGEEASPTAGAREESTADSCSGSWNNGPGSGIRCSRDQSMVVAPRGGCRRYVATRGR
jgi:hypothetical protein